MSAISSEAALFKVESIHHIHADQCLCGFKSSRSRDRTKHIMDVTLDAAAPIIRAEALEEAAEAIDADPYDDLDPFYVGWLKARAENIREGE